MFFFHWRTPCGSVCTVDTVFLTHTSRSCIFSADGLVEKKESVFLSFVFILPEGVLFKQVVIWYCDLFCSSWQIIQIFICELVVCYIECKNDTENKKGAFCVEPSVLVFKGSGAQCASPLITPILVYCPCIPV